MQFQDFLVLQKKIKKKNFKVLILLTSQINIEQLHKWRHDTQDYDVQYSDTQHNNKNVTQHINTQNLARLCWGGSGSHITYNMFRGFLLCSIS